jgi:NhaP-type Na+/H+ and K+/H+ antiporter
LGGESLVNDATGLLGVSLATVVVMTGTFEAGRIGLRFAQIAGYGILIGAAVGFAAARLNSVVRGTNVLFAFSLVAPYAAYFFAEHAGASGVLAVVIAGFVASWRLHAIAPDSRVELYSSWDQLTFVLNALMFLYVGLETPHRLTQAFDAMGTHAAGGVLIGVALLISLAVILARVVWVFPGAYIPLALFPKIREREGGYPRPRAVALATWCGVRGAVSLAAALSIPQMLPNGDPFPGRAEIIACTLVVILVTLIGQGSPCCRSSECWDFLMRIRAKWKSVVREKRCFPRGSRDSMPSARRRVVQSPCIACATSWPTSFLLSKPKIPWHAPRHCKGWRLPATFAAPSTKRNPRHSWHCANAAPSMTRCIKSCSSSWIERART